MGNFLKINLNTSKQSIIVFCVEENSQVAMVFGVIRVILLHLLEDSFIPFLYFRNAVFAEVFEPVNWRLLATQADIPRVADFLTVWPAIIPITTELMPEVQNFYTFFIHVGWL